MKGANPQIYRAVETSVYCFNLVYRLQFCVLATQLNRSQWHNSRIRKKLPFYPPCGVRNYNFLEFLLNINMWTIVLWTPVLSYRICPASDLTTDNIKLLAPEFCI